MKVETGTCFDCAFWLPHGGYRGDVLGECKAPEAPEPVVQLVVRRKLGAQADPDDFMAALVTPPDFFCSSWQDASKLDTPR